LALAGPVATIAMLATKKAALAELDNVAKKWLAPGICPSLPILRISPLHNNGQGDGVNI
jgi:hypothetical protein